MASDLKPCPFCGGDDIQVGHTRTGDFVACRPCGGAITGYRKPEYAISAWNRRTEPPGGKNVRVEKRCKYLKEGETCPLHNLYCQAPDCMVPVADHPLTRTQEKR